MGIYNGRKYIYVAKKKNFIKSLRNKEDVFSVGIDAEHAIGTGHDKKLSDDDLVKYIKDNYINPYLRNGISVFMVFSGKQIKYQNEILNRRTNDKLKWKKSVLKSYSNQDHESLQNDVLEFIWKKLVDFFKKFPPQNDKLLCDLYWSIFVEGKPDLIMNSENYVDCMRKIGKYVWDNSDPIFKLFEKIIVQRETVTLNDIPYNIVWDLSYNHWCGNMSQKRLVEHIKYVKDQLKGIVPIVDSTYDGDDQLVIMVKLGIIHAIVSGDSDFFAFNSNIVIVDINPNKNLVEYIKLSDMYALFEKKGYNRTMVRNAMLISTADYNPVLYKYRISFGNSLKACVKRNGNKRGYYELFEYFCTKHKISYNEKKAKEVSHAYTSSTHPEDIVDAINVVVKSLMNYIYRNEILEIKSNSSYVSAQLYLYFIKILLSFIKNNKILNVKKINDILNMYKRQTYSSIKEVTQQLRVQ